MFSAVRRECRILSHQFKRFSSDQTHPDVLERWLKGWVATSPVESTGDPESPTGPPISEFLYDLIENHSPKSAR